MTRTPRQTELTAISRNTPDTTSTPTVTDREHDGWSGGGGWVGIKAGVEVAIYKWNKLNKGI